MDAKVKSKQIMEVVKSAGSISAEEQDRIVREIDVTAAAALFPQMEVFEIKPMLHKCRYEMVGMDDSMRHESRAYLEERGYNRLKNLAWPEAGKLIRADGTVS